MEGGITNRDAQTLLLMRRLPVEDLHKLRDALHTLVTHGLSEVENVTSLCAGVGQLLLPAEPDRPKTRDVVSWIDKTEERGITVSQLEEVYTIIELNCSTWIESFKDSPNFGKALVAKEVNLYQTVKSVIKPRTEPHKCSYVELVAQGPQVLCAMCHQSRNHYITLRPFCELISCFVMQCVAQHVLLGIHKC